MTSKYDVYDEDYEDLDAIRRRARREVRNSRRDVIAGRLRQLEAELADISRWGEDDWPDGTVWMVEASYQGSETVYQFAVIKVVGRWWITGPRQHRIDGRRWDDIVAWLNEFKAVTVWRVTAMEEHTPKES